MKPDFNCSADISLQSEPIWIVFKKIFSYSFLNDQSCSLNFTLKGYASGEDIGIREVLPKIVRCEANVKTESATYYRCTKKNKMRQCFQPYVREEDLNIQISDLLKPFSLRADWADEMLTQIKDEKKQSAQSSALMAGQKRGEIEKINLRLQKLLDSFLDGIIDREAYVAEKSKGMSQKKSLEEQCSALLKGRADWLEPFQNWIISARNAGEIAVSDSLQQKRVLALEVFGSNLILDCKKARGSCVKPWSALVANSQTGGMVRAAGVEPATFSFGG
jgi:hypothetical protein